MPAQAENPKTQPSVKQKLAVLDLDHAGVDSDLAYSMSVVLRDELFSQGEYEILSREDLIALAKRLSLQQSAGECTDDQCLVSYGRALGTRYMVAGVITKIGKTYSISLRMLDTDAENPGVKNRVNKRCACDLDDLFGTMAEAASELMGKPHKIKSTTTENRENQATEKTTYVTASPAKTTRGLSSQSTTKAQESSLTPSDDIERLVVLETNMGKIKIELFDAKAPLSAENFRDYVKQGFYDGLIFHRVIPGFMIQGGGFASEMKQKRATRGPVPNEATNGLKNLRGTLAMARTSDIHSATSQFFINLVDNGFLDHRGNSPQTFGYAVFGRVVEGMDVVDKIAKTPTASKGMYQNVPVKDVIIVKAYEEKAK